ncbi:Bacterial membrane protein YfhO [uncultured Blautia sp.]
MNIKKKFTKINFLHLILILSAALLLTWLIVPKGHLFGSETDWYCQHVNIADAMRKQFFVSGKWFPDFTELGGGTNFYTLAYYGFFRPDVFLGYFLPWVSTETLVQGYAIFEILLGAGLFYFWLIKKKISNAAAFTAGILYVSANCLFQAHRQLMFVNYLPFLLLSFLCLDNLGKERNRPLFLPHFGVSLSFFFIILHSFYFFPACFTACTLYYMFFTEKQGSKFSLWFRYLFSAALPVLCAMFFLLPTGLVILENKKDVKGSSLLEILAANPTLDSLLYSPYGCGLTLICLYALFLSIRKKETRKPAVILFCFLFFHIFYWILNGTLYVRPKSLIPFFPILLFLTAKVLMDLWENRLTHSLPLCLICMIPVFVQAVFCPSKNTGFTFLDAILLLVFATSGSFFHRKGLSYRRIGLWSCLILAAPVLLFLKGSEKESFPEKSCAAFTEEEILSLCRHTNSRFDILESPLSNTNFVYSGNQKKSTMYSSVSNSSYNRFVYDTLNTPISVRNRVSINGNPNPFQEYLMGVRYIQTTKDKLPAGYTVLKEKNGTLLAENKNVLPLAYGSTSLISQKTFENLSFPHTLSALTSGTIVPDNDGNIRTDADAFSSDAVSYALPDDFFARPSSKAFNTKKELPVPLENEVLILSFDVRYSGRTDIDITINGVRNRLSGSTAPYPNRNTLFTYMISQNTPLKELSLSFSEGNYKIGNVKSWRFPVSSFQKQAITSFIPFPTEGKELLHGTITMEEDGYFVTSLPMSRGYHAYVDGKKTKPETVNQTFVGFPLKKGTHEVTLSFHAPGKVFGCMCSCLAFFYLAGSGIVSLLLMPGHKNGILHRPFVVTFSDSVSCKSHTLIKADSRFISCTDLQMNGVYTLLPGKTNQTRHKEMADSLSLSVSSDCHICNVSLVKNHEKTAVPENSATLLHNKKHGIFLCKKCKKSFLRPRHMK